MDLQPISRKHLGDQVYQVLWRKIVHGQIPSGSSISEDEVASQLKVSRTPVREALHRLEFQGLVAPGPNGRPRVTPPTARDIDEIYPLIGSLEGLAAREAVEHLTGPDLQHMREWISSMEAHGLKREIEQLVEVDHLFHGLLYERCRNRRLRRFVEELRSQMERFEYAFFSSAGHLKASMARHRMLVDLLAAGDPVAVQRAVESNWEIGRSALLESVKQLE